MKKYLKCYFKCYALPSNTGHGPPFLTFYEDSSFYNREQRKQKGSQICQPFIIIFRHLTTLHSAPCQLLNCRNDMFCSTKSS